MVIAKNKKFKPQMNNTIKAMDYNWTPGPEPPNNQDAGGPRAIFIPHSNSLPFDERRVTLDQPVKVHSLFNYPHYYIRLVIDRNKDGAYKFNHVTYESWVDSYFVVFFRLNEVLCSLFI